MVSISGGIDLILGIVGCSLLIWGIFLNGGALAIIIGAILIGIGVFTAINKNKG